MRDKEKAQQLADALNEIMVNCTNHTGKHYEYIKTTCRKTLEETGFLLPEYKPESMNSHQLFDLLENVCHTMERGRDGNVYTLSDVRFPDLEGVQIEVALIHGRDVAKYI